jgi:hypothetical protein
MTSYLCRYVLVYLVVVTLYINRYIYNAYANPNKFNPWVLVQGALNIFCVVVVFCILATIAECIAVRIAPVKRQWLVCLALLVVVWGLWRIVVIEAIVPSYWPPTCIIMEAIWLVTFPISAWQRRANQRLDPVDA